MKRQVLPHFLFKLSAVKFTRNIKISVMFAFKFYPALTAHGLIYAIHISFLHLKLIMVSEPLSVLTVQAMRIGSVAR